MQFLLDNASARPVYQQIIDQVKRDIALGRLIKDEKLPTVRQLAAQLAINPNTIGKAYRQLEHEGIIVTRPGAGAFVASLNSNLSDLVKERIIREEIERLVVEAVHMRLDKRQLQRWFTETADKFKFKPEKG